MVVLWNIDAECGQIFIGMSVPANFYITPALLFEVHNDVGCGNLLYVVLRMFMAAVLTEFLSQG